VNNTGIVDGIQGLDETTNEKFSLLFGKSTLSSNMVTQIAT
jgi:hypothetical protein